MAGSIVRFLDSNVFSKQQRYFIWLLGRERVNVPKKLGLKSIYCLSLIDKTSQYG